MVDFKPRRDGPFTASLTLESSDPFGGPIRIALQGNSTTDPKDVKDKENKDSKDRKDAPDKVQKDNKDNKDNKDSKDNPDNKENKENQDKRDKEYKDRKDKEDIKEGKESEKHPKDEVRLRHAASWPAILLGPAEIEGQADQATGKAFIRPDERPELGDPALNEPLDERNRKHRRALPFVPSLGSEVGTDGPGVV